MKQIQEKTESSTQGVLSEQSFGIDNLEVVFDILRNKLYKDPIVAVCREISCNARDANREAKCGKEPIEIVLPSIADPNLRIKDSGIGISPERAKTIYTKYGSSTKREDNEQVGMFGLGSKSVWAYSDTFTIITTCSDHKTRTYSAYIDSTRIGKLALLSEAEDLSAPTGTTIIIPVKSGDYAKFISATIDATQYWDVKPILKGAKLTSTWNEIKILHSGDMWALLNSNTRASYYYDSRSTAVIDGIGYLIDDKHLPKLTQDHKKILANTFLFYFGNGELSLSASRDSIHYDERTQKLLATRIDAVQKELTLKISAKIQSQPTYREAAHLTEITKSQINFDNFLNKLTWGGEIIHTNLSVGQIGDWAKITGYIKNGTMIDCLNGGNRSTQVFHSLVPTETQATVFVTKIDRIPRVSVKSYFDSNSKLKELKVLCMPEIPTSLIYKKKIKRKEEVKVSYNQKLFKMLNLTEMPLVKVKASPKSKIKSADDNSTVLGYQMSVVNFYKTSAVTEVPNTGGIYVEYDPTTKLILTPGLSLDRSTEWGRLEGILGSTIYGFSKNKLPKLKSTWKTVAQAIEDRLTTCSITQNQVIADAQSSYWMAEYELRLSDSNIPKLLKLLGENSTMAEYLKDSQRVVKSINDNKSILFLLKEIKKMKFSGPYYNEYGRYNGTPVLPTPKAIAILSDLSNKVKNKYRLLTKINSLRDIDLTTVAEYINLIDQKK